MKKLIVLALLCSGLFAKAQIQFTLVNPTTQQITIKNFGITETDISQYRLCSLFDYTFSGLAASTDVTVLSGDLSLSENESVTISWTAPSGFVPAGADLNLYLPSGAFNNPDNMVCFMEYGSSGNGREPEAVLAGLWAAGTFVSGNAPYTYTGNGTQSGVAFWTPFVLPDTDVVINEMDSDTPGTDMLEFVELYGSPNESLDGMVLVFFNGNNDMSYHSIDLDGLTCDATGFFLAGNSGVAGVDVTFGNNTLQNGADAVALYWGDAADWPDNVMVTTNALIDALVYDTGQLIDVGLSVLVTAGGQVNEAGGGNVTGHSLSRIPDGGAQLNTSSYTTQLPTPGATNILPACDGGFVLTDNGDSDVLVCTDANADVITFSHMTTEPGATYEYVVTDQDDNIILYPAGDNQDFNSYSIAVYHVYGISYQGNLDASTTESGDPVSGIASDGACVSISQSFINVLVQECVEVPECSELFISEYIEGLSSNKAIEIFNPTNLPVNLVEYALKNYANGGTSASNVFGLSGTLNPGDVYVVVHPNAEQVYQDLADATATVAFFNGNDAVALEHNGILIDAVGVIGEDPGTGGWVAGTGTTTDHVLVRKPDVNAPTANWFVSSALQWDAYSAGITDYLGGHVFLPCGTTLPQITFSTSAMSVAEESGSATVTIDVFNPIATVQVIVDILDATALSVEDYDATGFPITLTFPQGDLSSQTITIPIVDDAAEEQFEYFTLQMSANESEVNLVQDFINVVIEENDTYYPLYEIGQVTTENSFGVCDSLEVDCELRGIVHGINFNSAGVNFTLIDATDGINVFAAFENLGYTVVEGDSVHVNGEVYQFMGLVSFHPTSITLIDGGHPLETPAFVEVLGEENESHMVRIECVELVDSSQWDNSGGLFKVNVSDGVNDFVLVIDGDADIFGTDPPEGHFSVTGIGGQFDAASPYDGYYEMWPRSLDDFSDQVIAQFVSDPASIFQFGDVDLDVQFTSESFGASDFSWDFGDGESSDTENPQHTYTVDFLNSVEEVTVVLTVTSDGGCSDSYNMVYEANYVGMGEYPEAGIAVFPNPVNSLLHIICPDPVNMLTVTDARGGIVLAQSLAVSRSAVLDVSALAPGIYSVRITTGAGGFSRMILKQ